MREYSDAEYEEELERIREEFVPLVERCRELGRAMRIGTNHGSLSDRIMNRFGDTPLGMVESALEFARIARDHDYHEMVFSMKSSNPKVMIEAYRLLVARLHAEGPDWNYPIHLGVTEAGDGEDGRIKSAIGMGSLLGDGIGDTLRVSLTEDSIHEIPVAQALAEIFAGGERACCPSSVERKSARLPFDPFSYARRASEEISAMGVRTGGKETIRVVTPQVRWNALAERIAMMGDNKPEIILEKSGVVEIDPRDAAAVATLNAAPGPRLVAVVDGLPLEVVEAHRLLASVVDARHPLLLKDTLTPGEDSADALLALLRAASRLGSLLCDGLGDAVLVRGEAAPGASLRLAYNILQAAGCRIFKTDYVACPSCGRTLFNLQHTTRKIREATGHLKGVRIAVMGCIVNGPGEMADADFGYVGGAPGKVNLYVGKTAVKFNIPEEEAVKRLTGLIREHGKWVEPPVSTTTGITSLTHHEPGL